MALQWPARLMNDLDPSTVPSRLGVTHEKSLRLMDLLWRRGRPEPMAKSVRVSSGQFVRSWSRLIRFADLSMDGSRTVDRAASAYI